MKFQHRDGEILKTIFENDGVLGKRHLKDLYWPSCSWRAMERRLSKLFNADYLSWPSIDQRWHYLLRLVYDICEQCFVHGKMVYFGAKNLLTNHLDRGTISPSY